MIEYRTYLTGLVAVFLALGLGMLIGSAIIGSPSAERQQKDLRGLQQNFAEFSQKYADLRAEADSAKGRLAREDEAMREVLPSFVDRRLVGRTVAIVLCGELDDTAFVDQVTGTLKLAGATVTSTTSIRDDWLPSEDPALEGVVKAFGLSGPSGAGSQITVAVGRAIASGKESSLAAASRAATGLRLDGDYTHPVDCVLMISGTRTQSRFDAERVKLTPEAALLSGFSQTPVRVVAAETDGDEELSIIPHVSHAASATVDNIDMASGQLSAVYALAGRDGRFGIKRTAERAIPEIAQ